MADYAKVTQFLGIISSSDNSAMMQLMQAFDAATGSVPKKLLLKEMERIAQKVNKNMKAELIERMLKDSGIQ